MHRYTVPSGSYEHDTSKSKRAAPYGSKSRSVDLPLHDYLQPQPAPRAAAAAALANRGQILARNPVPEVANTVLVKGLTCDCVPLALHIQRQSEPTVEAAGIPMNREIPAQGNRGPDIDTLGVLTRLLRKYHHAGVTLEPVAQIDAIKV